MSVFTQSAPRVIAWMCAAHVASMAGISTYATLLPRLQDDWALNNSQAGLISGAFFAGYMAAVPLLASLTDRVDARRVYAVSSLVAAAALAAFALFANGLVSAALLQVLAGAGIAGTYMPGLRALTDNLQGTRTQSRAVAFYTAVFGLGTSLSILLSGQIADALGLALGIRPRRGRAAARRGHGGRGPAAAQAGRRSRHPRPRLPPGVAQPRSTPVHLRLRGALLGAVRLALLAGCVHRVRARPGRRARDPRPGRR